jgi:hypothetical protein
MFKSDAITMVLMAIATLGIELLLVADPFAMDLVTLAGDELAQTFLAISTAVAIPVAYVMPRLRVSLLGQIWRVPSSTYLLPRSAVLICICTMLGQVIALLLWAVIGHDYLLWLAASSSLVGGAFCAGAWQRLSRHPSTEFSMRWWPRI